MPLPGARYLVYFGTYTGAKSKGVYVSRFDPASGKLEPARLAGELARPSWLTVHPNQRVLYAVSELGNDARSEGAIASFSIDPSTGELKLLNQVSSGGGGACHLAVDRTAKAIAVANYGTGSVALFALDADGRLGRRLAFVQHHGSSVNERRQSGPHAHAVVLSPDNRFLFVPDLGLDQILSYRFDPTAGLAPNDPPFAKVKPGLGPRHFAFHPNGKFAYCLTEMGSAVTAFSYDAQKGALAEIQNISSLPPDFSGEDNSAEIALDDAGRFLYASNRGHDSIAVFAVDSKKGTLAPVEYVPTQGKNPRNFGIDPTGRHLLAANQNSDNVVVFRRDEKTGRLSPAGQVLDVPSPVCIQFVKE